MNTYVPEMHMQSVKTLVSGRLRAEWRGHLPEALIRRAIDEAELTAQATGFPQLFFPVLAEEKVRSVHSAVTADFSHRAA